MHAVAQALSTQVARRHTRSSNGARQGPNVEVVYGNWVNGKRRGVVGGVDYGYTGKVRSLNTASINSQLQSGHIVLLTSLAYSLAGKPFGRDCGVCFSCAPACMRQLKADSQTLATELMCPDAPAAISSAAAISHSSFQGQPP